MRFLAFSHSWLVCPPHPGILSLRNAPNIAQSENLGQSLRRWLAVRGPEKLLSVDNLGTTPPVIHISTGHVPPGLFRSA